MGGMVPAWLRRRVHHNGGVPDATVKQRIEELAREVQRLNDAYYGEGDSPLPDAEYDAMKDELAALVAEHPDLEPADSPLGKVNAPSELTGPTVRHARPMLSLAKATTFTLKPPKKARRK